MKIDGVTFDNVTISSCPHGEVLFDTPGTYSWVAPAGVTSVSVVCIGGGAAGQRNGGGGGGGGGLGYKNNLTVTPGTSYTVVVGQGGPGLVVGGDGNSVGGGESYFINNTTVRGAGGSVSANATSTGGAGGTFVGDGGGNGGAGGNSIYTYVGGGGGGAGGWTGSGGAGGAGGYTGLSPAVGTSGLSSTAGGGGGGAGGNQLNAFGASTGGGGVSFYSSVTNGIGGTVGTGTNNRATFGTGGSEGSNGKSGLLARSSTADRGWWGTTTGTIAGAANILTFGGTQASFADSLANFGTDFVGLRVRWTSSPTDIFIIANVSGTGLNSQWRLNKTPASLPSGSQTIYVVDAPDGGDYGGGGGGGNGADSSRGQGGNGAVRIIWPGQTRSFPSTKVVRIVDYGLGLPNSVNALGELSLQALYDPQDPASFPGTTTFNDVSGNGFNGTFAIAPSRNTLATVTYDGSSQFFTSTSTNNQFAGYSSSTGLSFVAWINPTALGGQRFIFDKSNLSGTAGVGAYVSGSGNIRAINGSSTYTQSTTALVTGTWYNVIITIDSSQTLLYYINNSAAQNGGNTGAISTTVSPLKIGANANDSGKFNGQIGQLAVYKTTLTSTDVAYIYNTTKWRYGL